MCTVSSSPASPYGIATAFSGLVTAQSAVVRLTWTGTPRYQDQVHLCRTYWLFLPCRPSAYQTKICHKFVMKSKIMTVFSAYMSGNKLGSAHCSCLVSFFTISCCTVLFTFYRFSIWSLYLLVFFIYHTSKGSFELRYYLRQILIEISGVKVVYFCTKKIFNPRGYRRIWWRGY